jgi:DNA polymerase/3'-5' exonuclease PolX
MKAMQLKEAEERVTEIIDALEPHCNRVEASGQVRRRCASVSQIDVVLIPRDPMQVQRAIMSGAAYVELFGSHIARVEMKDQTRVNFHFAHDDQSTMLSAYPCNWGSVMLHTTGPKEFNARIIRRAGQLALCWNIHHGLFNAERVCIASATEEEILSRLGFAYVKPEERQ